MKFAKVKVYIGILSCKNLLQLCAAEIAKTTVTDNCIKELSIDAILETVQLLNHPTTPFFDIASPPKQ